MSPAIASPDISISDLCDMQAWPRRRLWLWVYAPVGIVIACLRLLAVPAFSLVASFVPQRQRPPIFRALRAVMGIRVKRNLTHDQVGAHVDGCVVASNHISLLDNFLVSELPHTTIMVGDPISAANPISVAIGYMAFHCAGGRFWTIRDRRQLVRQFAGWKNAPHGTALYVTPETTINNGRGLFRFQPEFLTRGMPVVPLAIRLETPFGLRPHPLHDSGLANVFRLLMMPWLSYDMTWLPQIEMPRGQTQEEFARQVQQAVAGHLRIAATDFSRAEKHAFRRATAPVAR